MKGVIAFLVIIGLTVGIGVWVQADLDATVKECSKLLSEADGYCEDRKYALSQAAAEHFCALWEEKEHFYVFLYKYNLYDEISQSTHKLIPLLVEKNLSEYRALCLETIYHLRLLQSYESFSLEGVF